MGAKSFEEMASSQQPREPRTFAPVKKAAKKSAGTKKATANATHNYTHDYTHDYTHKDTHVAPNTWVIDTGKERKTERAQLLFTPTKYKLIQKEAKRLKISVNAFIDTVTDMYFKNKGDN